MDCETDDPSRCVVATVAEQLLRRLYGAITSRYECLLRMDRFEAPEQT